ncbi:Het-C-domain-containing protein [Dentipellis sp. KUC8613]|nr:Het-C-domain-containing protein [Dentipellis sp. KUC8613]
MPSLTTNLLLLTIVLVLLPPETYAFGAGDIPDFSYLNNKAFRHGDIENILTEVAKAAGKGAAGGGILSIASSILSGGSSGGKKFNKGDVKKVYFGNWLRDYSQAMDIAGLSKLTADTLVLIVAVLGFMTFGFATEEFEVTPDRLAVYLPVEHIDNPKGYAEKEGDARRFHPKLRPPVNPRELEIDPRTGMKNYMASDNQGWDTSTAHIRRTLRACIEHGRRSRGEEGADLWEAYRLLGTGLHTLEDLLAHSNWCEIALRKMGHEQIFCHVGDSVIIDTPNGPAPPLVTGTFGSADFMHSMMGEATDHLSQGSVTDLSQKMNDAAGGDSESVIRNLKNLLSKIPLGGGSDQMNTAEDLHKASKAYNFDPNNVAPPEVQRQLWALLKWRDSIYRAILEKIEMIPGLSDLIDGITDALNAYVYTILAPWLTPILTEATEVLGEGSKAVIDSDDQYEVFNNPRASDPSHSLLSKDHFQLILNEPAGKIAQVVVQHTVQLIVQAWFDDRSNPDEVIDRILEAFHHPYYNVGRSQIQNAMFEAMERWLSETGEERDEILQSLTKESVRNGQNKRKGSDDETAATPGGSHAHGGGAFASAGQYTSPGDYLSKENDEQSGYSSRPQYGEDQGSQNYGRSSGGEYNQEQSSYGSGRQEESYGGGRRDEYEQEHRRHHHHHQEQQEQEQPSYGRQEETRSSGYGYESQDAPRRDESAYRPSYGEQATESRYGNEESYGRQSGYDEQPSYGGGRRQEERSSYQPAYEQPASESRYGRESEGYGGRSGYGEQQSYGGGGYSEQQQSYGGGGYGEQQASRRGGYEEERSSRREEEPSYGRGSYAEQPSYRESRQEQSYGGGDESSGYGRRAERQAEEYGGRQEDQYGGRQEEQYGGGRESYGRSGEYEGGGYGGGQESYGEERRSRGGYEDEGNQETFSAENLTLDEGQEGYGRREGGYGNEGYEQNY